MRIDYSDKMGPVREGVERKPVQKNRPRKEPVGMFALLSVLVLLATFGSGVMTGWFLFKGGHKAAPVSAAALAPAQRQQEPAPPAGQPEAPPPEAPLTFYKTLPSGGQSPVIGSGLNPKKVEQAPAQPHPAPAAAPAAKPATEKQEGATRYLVQIASYRGKQEAEAAQAKLSAKGVAAYLVESRVQDRGVWYRLRVGRHLSRGEAEELAGKAGSGAAVLAE